MNFLIKIKKVWSLSLVVIVLLGVFVGVWFLISETPIFDEQNDVNAVSNDVSVPDTDSNASTDQYKIYQNDEFGFSFRYPLSWSYRSPAFGSSASLYNMTVEENGAQHSQITINITQKNWIESALAKMRARGVSISDIVVASRPALQLEDKDWIGRPATSVLVLVNDEYWIDITGVKGHEEVYNMVLNSFVIE